MATLDLRDPALRERYGLRQGETVCAETIPAQSQFRRRRRSYRRRAELTGLVFETVAGASRPLSRREIANAMGYSKNGYLLDALAELVTLGRIVEDESDWFGIPMFVYEVAS